MSTTPPRPEAPTFLDLAKKSVGSIPSVSKSYKPHPTKSSAIFGSWAQDIHPSIRINLASDPHFTVQTVFIADGHLRVLTRPTLASVTPTTGVVRGSLGDSFENPIPVTIPDALDAYVITLLPRSITDQFNLPVAAADPSTLEAPANDDPGADPIPPGYERLGYTVTTEADMPRLVWLPATYSVPLGEHLFVDVAITDPLPEDTSFPDGFAAWHRGMRFLYTHHGGNSLHHLPTLFNPTDFGDPLPFPAHQLRDSPTIPYTLVAPYTPAHDSITRTMRELHDDAFLRVAGPRQTTPHPVSPDGPEVLQAVIHSAVNAVYDRSNASVKLSTTEREFQKDQADVTLRYRLLFGALCDTYDESGQVVGREVSCPALTPEFTKILEASKTNRILSFTKEAFDQHVKRRAASDKFLDNCANFDVQLLDLPFLTSLRNFSWATQPPIEDRDSVNDKLGIYHFARPDKQCVQYTTRVSNGRTLLRQEQLGEDDTKKNKKTTDLYHTGKMSTATDIDTVIGNLWLFLTFACNAFDSVTNIPVFWRVVLTYLKIKNGPEGRTWAERHRNTPHVFIHMINSLQHILGAFVSVACTHQYRSALGSGGTISPKALDDAKEAATLECTKLRNDIRSGELGEYRDIPAIMSVLVPSTDAPTSPKDPKGSSTKRKRDTPGTPPGGTHPTTSRPDQARIDRAKKSGLVKFSGSGKPPACSNILIPHPVKGTPAMICANFTTHDYFCRFGDKCNFVHLTSIASLPSDKQTAYKKFVEDTPTLSWAPSNRNGASSNNPNP